MALNNSTRKKLFLSSTYIDLEDSRKAATEAIRLLDDYEPIGMEQFGARSTAPVEHCLSLVRKCDVFVCLVGHRLGSKPPGSEKSYTQLEYEMAKSLQKDRLVFIYDGPLEQDHIEGEMERAIQRAFRSELRNELVVASYKKAKDIGELVVASLSNLKVIEQSKHPGTSTLLFPFVTSSHGCDTALTVSNISQGPGTLTLGIGIVSFYFYGTLPNLKSPQDSLVKVEPTSICIGPGRTITFSLKYGGPEAGLHPVIGFNGYVYAICNFPNARGYAQISDATGQSSGYLAEIFR